MIRIFIGYDPREAIAYHVLCHSILSRSTRPVLITPLGGEEIEWHSTWYAIASRGL